MKQSKTVAKIWLLTGFLCSALVLLVVCTGLAGKTIVADPAGIPETANEVMDCIRYSNWEALSEMAYGCPSLVPATEEANSAQERIWKAYQESLQWTCPDDFALQDAYVTQKILVQCLDIHAVTGAMAEILSRSQASSAESEKQEQLLYSAAEQVLLEEMPVTEREITLTFLRENGRWLVIPDRELQALLSGFTAY